MWVSFLVTSRVLVTYARAEIHQEGKEQKKSFDLNERGKMYLSLLCSPGSNMIFMARSAIMLNMGEERIFSNNFGFLQQAPVRIR